MEATKMPWISPSNSVNKNSLLSPSSSLLSPKIAGQGSLTLFRNCNTLEEYHQERLNQRCNFLRTRLNIYDECKRQIDRLMAGYKHMYRHRITERDLIIRRSKLSSDDIIAVTQGIKLKEIIGKNQELTDSIQSASSNTKKSLISAIMPSKMKFKLDILKLSEKGKFTAQAIGNLHPFLSMNPTNFIPATVFYEIDNLPNSFRHPMKPWKLCNYEEQLLELMLACTMDCITELAIEDGIMVPDLEDVYVDKSTTSFKAIIWEEFKLWYVGEEIHQRIPGKGAPSLPRVIFAEEWEKKVVLSDEFIRSEMNQLGWFDIDSYNEDTFGSPSSKSRQTSSQGNKREEINMNNIDEIVGIYEGYIQQEIGTKIRLLMLRRYVDIVCSSRQASMLYFITPPAINRSSIQFMIPRNMMNILIPNMEISMPRITVFPSKSIEEAYHIQEICSWDSNGFDHETIDEDDRLMMEAELLGRKRKKYLDWLVKEPDRVAYSREEMAMEDKLAWIDRKYWNNIDELMISHEKHLLGSLHDKNYDPDRIVRRIIEKESIIHSVADSDDENDSKGTIIQGYGSVIEIKATEEDYYPLSQHNNPSDGFESLEMDKEAVSEGISSSLMVSSPSKDVNVYPLIESHAFNESKQTDSIHGHQILTIPRGIVQRETIYSKLPRDLDFHHPSALSSTAIHLSDALVDANILQYQYFHGNGADNDDELEKMLSDKIQLENDAKRRDEQLQQRIREEKAYLELQEDIKRKNEELDRRLEENIERRKEIRSEFEDIKQRRELEAMERQRQIECENEREREERKRLDRMKKEIDERNRLKEIELKENASMGWEDRYCHDIWTARREMQLMNHEERLSHGYEKRIEQLEALEARRLREYEELYEEFKEFDFVGSEAVRLRQLHRILSHDSPNPSHMKTSRGKYRSNSSETARETAKNGLKGSKTGPLPAIDDGSRDIGASMRQSDKLKDRINQMIEQERLRLSRSQYDAALASYSSIDCNEILYEKQQLQRLKTKQLYYDRLNGSNKTKQTGLRGKKGMEDDPLSRPNGLTLPRLTNDSNPAGPGLDHGFGYSPSPGDRTGTGSGYGYGPIPSRRLDSAEEYLAKERRSLQSLELQSYLSKVNQSIEQLAVDRMNVRDYIKADALLEDSFYLQSTLKTSSSQIIPKISLQSPTSHTAFDTKGTRTREASRQRYEARDRLRLPRVSGSQDDRKAQKSSTASMKSNKGTARETTRSNKTWNDPNGLSGQELFGVKGKVMKLASLSNQKQVTGKAGKEVHLTDETEADIMEQHQGSNSERIMTDSNEAVVSKSQDLLPYDPYSSLEFTQSSITDNMTSFQGHPSEISQCNDSISYKLSQQLDDELLAA